MSCAKYLNKFLESYKGGNGYRAQALYDFIRSTQNWRHFKTMPDSEDMSNEEIIRYVLKHCPKYKIDISKIAKHFVPNTELEYYLSENNRFFKRIKAMNLQLLPDTAERIIKEILDKCETAYAYTWVRYHHLFGYNRNLSYQQILNAIIDVAENEVIPFIQTRLDNMTDEYKLKLLYKCEEYKATVAYTYIQFFRHITDDVYNFDFIGATLQCIMDKLTNELFYVGIAYRCGCNDLKLIKKVFPTIPKVKSLYYLCRVDHLTFF